MTDQINKTHSYLSERFKSSNWRYYSLNRTKFNVGESFASDIKELREMGMVKPVGGINGWLIEVIPEKFCN